MDVLAIGSQNFSIHNVFTSRFQNATTPQMSFLYGGDDARMADASERRRSFIFWPSRSPADKEELVNAYFHFTGDDDEVKCHSCKVTHKGWTKSDDPLTIHLTKSPDCMLARGRAQAFASDFDSPWSVGVNQNVIPKRKTKKKNNYQPPVAKHEMDLTTDGSNSFEEVTPIINARLPARVASSSPNVSLNQLREESARLQTFVGNWPEENPLRPEDLARAGLFYKGPGDRVQCAFCKGILRSWTTGDSALGEHARHFPECPFVAKVSCGHAAEMSSPAVKALTNMGYSAEKIQEAQRRLHLKHVSNPSTDELIDEIFDMDDEYINTEKDDDNIDQDAATGESPKISQLREENNKLKMSSICRICKNAPAETLLLPCRHLVSCADCTSRINHCPLCNANIIGTVRTYLA